MERLSSAYPTSAAQVSLVRYTDFPALTALISATDPDRPDNYLLYEVEKEIMRTATKRIESAPARGYEVADATLLGARMLKFSEFSRKAIIFARRGIRFALRPVRALRIVVKHASRPDLKRDAPESRPSAHT